MFNELFFFFTYSLSEISGCKYKTLFYSSQYFLKKNKIYFFVIVSFQNLNELSYISIASFAAANIQPFFILQSVFKTFFYPF